jgi:hypothetical protein
MDVASVNARVSTSVLSPSYRVRRQCFLMKNVQNTQKLMIGCFASTHKLHVELRNIRGIDLPSYSRIIRVTMNLQKQ